MFQKLAWIRIILQTIYIRLYIMNRPKKKKVFRQNYGNHNFLQNHPTASCRWQYRNVVIFSAFSFKFRRTPDYQVISSLKQLREEYIWNDLSKSLRVKLFTFSLWLVMSQQIISFFFLLIYHISFLFNNTNVWRTWCYSLEHHCSLRRESTAAKGNEPRSFQESPPL